MENKTRANHRDDNELAKELEAIHHISSRNEKHFQLEKFVRDNPIYGQGHFDLAMSFLLNRFTTALGLTGFIVFGGPTHASRYEMVKHLEGAETHFQQAILLDPHLGDHSKTNIALVKLCRHRYGPAIIYIEELLADPQQKTTPFLKNYLGVAYREMGEYEMALSTFHSISENDLTSIHRHLAITYLCIGDLQKACSEMEAHMAQAKPQASLEKDSIDPLLQDAITHEAQGRRLSAIRVYDEIARRCRYDAIFEFLGITIARHSARLQGDDNWDLKDYCDQLAY